MLDLSSDFTRILIGLIVCAVVATLSFQRHFSVGKNYAYRRINWMIVCLGSISLAFVLLIHLVNLAGFETGNR